MPNIRLEIENRSTLNEAFFNKSVQGCIKKNGGVKALAEINSENSSVPALTQIEVLHHARYLLNPNVAIDNFIQKILNDRLLRVSKNKALQITAIPFLCKIFEKYNYFKQQLGLPINQLEVANRPSN